MAVDPSGRFAYVANFVDNSVSGYTIQLGHRRAYAPPRIALPGKLSGLRGGGPHRQVRLRSKFCSLAAFRGTPSAPPLARSRLFRDRPSPERPQDPW